MYDTAVPVLIKSFDDLSIVDVTGSVLEALDRIISWNCE